MTVRCDPACRIRTALRRLGERDGVEVFRAGWSCGRLSRPLLERAVRYGLGSATLASVLTDPPEARRGRGDLSSRMTARMSRVDLQRLRDLGRAVRRRGAAAYLVGGTVRDLAVGAKPRDIDVVVVGARGGLARSVARELGGRVARTSRFGTASLAFEQGTPIDLAAARRESYRHPASLPRVAAGSLAEDLERRDFGINAMAVDLGPRWFGRVVDPLGGRADLMAGSVRALHGLSFIEDPTRAWRAVRLAARLGLTIAPRTRRLIEAARAGGVFERLSAARVRREVGLLLEETHADGAARLAARLGLWETLHPGLRPGGESLEQLRRIERVWARHADWAERAGARRWIVGLGILLVGLWPAGREELLARLGPSRQALAVLSTAVPNSDRILRGLARGRRPTPGRLHRLSRGCPVEVVLLAATRARDASARRALERLAVRDREIRADIDGNDLLRAGVKAGPPIAAGLQAALEAKLDGRAPTKARQLAVARRAAART